MDYAERHEIKKKLNAWFLDSEAEIAAFKADIDEGFQASLLTAIEAERYHAKADAAALVLTGAVGEVADVPDGDAESPNCEDEGGGGDAPTVVEQVIENDVSSVPFSLRHHMSSYSNLPGMLEHTVFENREIPLRRDKTADTGRSKNHYKKGRG